MTKLNQFLIILNINFQFVKKTIIIYHKYLLLDNVKIVITKYDSSLD